MVSIEDHIREFRKRGPLKGKEGKLMSLNRMLQTKAYTQSSYIVAYDVINAMRAVEDERDDSKNPFVLAIPFIVDNLRKKR